MKFKNKTDNYSDEESIDINLLDEPTGKESFMDGDTVNIVKVAETVNAMIDIEKFWNDPDNQVHIKATCAMYGINEKVCSMATKESMIRFILSNLKK